MVLWFFRKKRTDFHKKFEELNNSLNNSFLHIKKDMDHVINWVDHFKDKHTNHEKKFGNVLKRINRIENVLEELQEVIYGQEPTLQKEEIVEEKEIETETPKSQDNLWHSLTETQQKVCWVLARIQKEEPEQWISLKHLAQEVYPDKDYNKIRSTLSQFITNLEEVGYVKRRRRGKQTYVYSTKKNPHLFEERLLKTSVKKARKGRK